MALEEQTLRLDLVSQLTPSVQAAAEDLQAQILTRDKLRVTLAGRSLANV